MEANITFNTDINLKALIEQHAAQSRTSVSVYLTALIRKAIAEEKPAKGMRELTLSNEVKKYMGIVPRSEDDWEATREERINQKCML